MSTEIIPAAGRPPYAANIFAKHRAVLQKAGWNWEAEDVASIARSIDARRVSASSTLLDLWLSRHPIGFLTLVSGPFASLQGSYSALHQVLSFQSDLLLLALVDPEVGRVEEISSITRALFTSDASLAVRLHHVLLDGIPSASIFLTDAMVERGLDVLQASIELERMSVHLVQLLKHPNQRIRSKAALLLAKGSGTTMRLLERYYREADPRVRANLVEGLWSVEAAGKAEMLWVAAKDSHHRVVANALIGLYRMGDPEAANSLILMAGHPRTQMRAAAAWAMGHLADPKFIEVLERLFREDRGGPKRNALRSLARIHQAREAGSRRSA